MKTRSHLRHCIWCLAGILVASASSNLLGEAKTKLLPDQVLVRSAAKDTHKLRDLLTDFLARLEQGITSVNVSQPNAVGTEVIPAIPAPSGVLNSGYMPLKPKQITDTSDKLREYSMILSDDLNQVTSMPSLAVFDRTKAIQEDQLALNSGSQKLLQILGEGELDRKTAASEVRNLLRSIEQIDGELRKYHAPLN